MPLSADVNTNLLRTLKIVQSIGEAVPHGGILKAVAGVGITILETAERARLNKDECADIARRAAEHISVLKRLDEDEELSDDLRERLQRYHRVLEEVSRAVERIGSRSKKTSILRVTSVSEETKECLDKLNEAYQTYIFEFSIAADNKLTTLVNGMQSLSLRMDLQSSSRQGETDEIPLRQIEFDEEISRVEKKTYILRIEHGKMTDLMGRRKAVILRRFEVKPEVEDRDRNLEEFKKELRLRGDLLNRHVARMLGIASSDTGRTMMIVIEAGTISAYEYLQNLPGFEYLCLRGLQDIDFSGNTEGLGAEGVEQYRDVLLSAKDKRLCMGGLGRMDSRWEDSGWRMDEAAWREQLRDGNDTTGGGSGSFKFYADEFERMRETVTRWNEEKTEENARHLFSWLTLWSGPNDFERETENLPTVGEIGWIDGKEWHPIPLVHHFPLADPQEYKMAASRLCDGEWETIVGTHIGGYTRWSIDVSLTEKVYLRTIVCSLRPNEIFDFFYGSALSLACNFGVDVGSLCLVSRTGFDVDVSLTISNEPSSTVYYFAHPPYSKGYMPDPPGFWSRCPYPLCSDCRLHADAAQVGFNVEPFVEYERITKPILSVLQDLESHGFLSIPDITYASNLPFASITEVSEHATGPTISKRPKKRFGDALLSAFSKKRKTS
ncbi:hypothetical protein SISNIDRAFT_471274 [Sistotremastrum niveocremeum HHB9708]|uniref:Mixed lineage kinase domain-containing protein n=1 Tax=Sistotremastrum niveocremeum HHB9708 TaxID=1314777 RepID=A0A164MUD4_9AGAM|nr:hypothetical protein SISNIDRAFT_471274 [Sistotremastrum niveocremeum HHB9708]